VDLLTPSVFLEVVIGKKSVPRDHESFLKLF